MESGGVRWEKTLPPMVIAVLTSSLALEVHPTLTLVYVALKDACALYSNLLTYMARASLRSLTLSLTELAFELAPSERVA